MPIEETITDKEFQSIILIALKHISELDFCKQFDISRPTLERWKLGKMHYIH